MRLGQLARKLEIRPAEILQFLSLNSIVIDDNTNSRLEEEHVILVLKHFNPDLLREVIVPEPIKNQPEDLPLPPHSSTGITETEEQPEEGQPAEITQEKSDIEVIKAPKIELSGLKILGKIELPEAKKKQDTSEPQTESANVDPLPEKPSLHKVRTGDRKLQRPDHRPRKNPIAQQREREALEEKKKREEQASREKERKTRKYYSKVKMSPPTKAVRMVGEPVMQMSAEELEEAPRTWLGRFIKWLTTA